jgi:hypothetical protein
MIAHGSGQFAAKNVMELTMRATVLTKQSVTIWQSRRKTRD